MRGPVRLAIAATSLALCVGVAVADAGTKVSANELGRTRDSLRPACPTPNGDNVPADKQCQVMARVTGVQTYADGRRNPFKVREDGNIVAWAVQLGDPNKQEQDFFINQIENSGPPAARLSIIKPKDDGFFKLIRQSPVVQVQSILGRRTIVTLTQPLRVKKGMFVALTTNTWLPNLAEHGASQSDTWLTSRDPGECGNEPNDSAEENAADLQQRSRPQQRTGGKRAYACEYSGARILYTAFFAPKGS